MSTFDFNDILNEAAKSRGGDNKESVRLSGTYNVEVGYANGSTRKKDGSKKNPSVSVKFVVLDGPQVGDEAWMNVTLTDKSKAVFGRTLLDLGIPESFLRSLGTASSEDEIGVALSSIAETLPGARYNITVGPNTKNPNFDNYVFNTIVEAPEVDQPNTQAAYTGAIPAPLAPVTPYAPSPTTPVVAVPGLPGGGFVPQLTN